MSWHERQARAGTICELARNYRESRTTHNTALAMERSLAPSSACSSRLSTLLIANACCSPTVYYSFVLQGRACCREKLSSNIINKLTHLQPHPKLWPLLRHIWSWKPKTTRSWSGKAPKCAQACTRDQRCSNKGRASTIPSMRSIWANYTKLY